MLITTCTQCGARFRVTPQQLNAKQGQVRCGRCSKVFNGFEALQRFPDDDTGGRLLAAAERASGQAPAPSPVTQPVEALRFEELPDIDGMDLPDSAEGETLATPEPSLPPAPASAEEAAPRQRTSRASFRPAIAITLPEPPRPKPPARAWTFGAVLLAIVLATELAYAFRAPVAQRYPVLRPYMESVCNAAGCRVGWSREESLLKLEDSELLEVPGKPDEIALNARIRNLAGVAQEYPHIELTLTDITGQAAVRRVLRPTDYLGRPTTGNETIAPGSDLTVQLRLETPHIKATGYELLLFYP
ncbi:MAG TPA: zinc-ribbon and DUF3426 domain-containing protein [Usitatibacter sp.]|nr:zinc-ribbon and DUF3426 domain-containing protein [Usitatibacter sp.]